MAISTDEAPQADPQGPGAPARIGAGWSVVTAVLSVAAALGVGELVAALVAPESSPFLAVGQAAIRLTPEPLKELAIAWFGTYDKVALLTGMTLTIVVVTVLAGLASRRDRRPGLVLVVVMGLLAFAAVISGPTFSAADLLAPVGALAAGVAAWSLLHERAAEDAVDPSKAISPADAPSSLRGPVAGGVGDPSKAISPADAPSSLRGPVAGGVGDPSKAISPADAPSSLRGPVAGGVGNPSTEGDGTSGTARRRLLLTTGGVALGAAATGLVGRALTSGGTSPASVGPLPGGGPPAPPANADFAASGTPTWITPNTEFYRIDTALSVPRISTTDWALRIHGMVDREVNLTWDSLRARSVIQAPITMTCVSNEVGGTLVSNAVWVGVALRDLLAEAGIRPGAQQIASTSSDGFNCNTPLGPLTDGRPAMLAFGMNGAALPVEHGFPVRMVVPGLFGYVSGCKWITDIEVTTFDGFTSYWEQRGWAKLGPIKTESRIDVPRAEASVPAGRTTVAGVAWAQHTGIQAVEVSVDGGPWQPTELAAEPTVDSWRMWRMVATLAPGAHELRVRATDRSGVVQTAEQAPVLPDGASGWHTVSVTAV